MMKAVPSVSVCMPVYNAAAYLRECIDSILSQSFEDFELLIADDGSTDNSREIVRTYDDARIRLIENKHDYIGSLNLLLREAKGKYIARMDADDVMMPTRLQQQFDYMETHFHVDILGGGMHYIGDSDSAYVPECQGRVTLDMLMAACIVAHPTVMLRKSSFEAKKLEYDRDFMYAEDYRLWVKALKAGLCLVNVKDIFIKYRLSESQVCRIHREEQLLVVERIKEDIAQWQFRNEIQWALPEHGQLPQSSNTLTVIIPFLNEKEEVERTIKEIRRTAGNGVDIIAINDCSYDGFPYGEVLAPYKVHYILNKKRKGVAASRDFGVHLCQTPYFLLLDAHMRFYDEDWSRQLVNELIVNDRQLLCCQTKFLHKNEATGDVSIMESCPQTYGAYSPFNPKEIWPDIVWNLKEKEKNNHKEEIPTVLGAGYAASKRYWTYLKGLAGLRYYGADESYISYKVWLEGGKCVLMKKIVIGHIYRTLAPYRMQNRDSIYNQLLISKLLFPQSLYCQVLVAALVYNKEIVSEVLRELSSISEYIYNLKIYYRSIFTKDIKDIIRLHLSYQEKNKEHVNNKVLCVLPEIYEVIQKEPFEDVGLYEGKAGVMFWLCHYSRYTCNPCYEEQASLLWTEVESAVLQYRLPWGFKYGLSGIGWCALYLWFNNMLDEYPQRLIGSVDEQLSLINPSMCNDFNFETGLTGVMAYLCLRCRVGPLGWPRHLVEDWKRVAYKVAKNPSYGPETYYALLFLSIQEEGRDEQDVPPSFLYWIAPSKTFPKNKKYWDHSLTKGVLATSIWAMNSAYNYKK